MPCSPVEVQCLIVNIPQSWYSLLSLKDTLKAFDDFKNKQKSVWSNVFWYVKVYVFWKFIQYTIHWVNKQTLEKFPSDKINVKKLLSFFYRELPLITAFLCNSYELTCYEFHFRFRFVFIKGYIFVQQKAWILRL